METIRWLFRTTWDICVGVFGNAAWEDLKKRGVPIMIGTLLYAAWDIIVSPLGPRIFIDCLGAFAVGLFISNQLQVQRLQKKWERGELTPSQDPKREEALGSALHTIEELQTKIMAIEDTRPHLEAEGIAIYRAIHQPTLPRELPQAFFRKETGSFTLLRITNKPKSTNREAVALDLYASISYFDAQENKIFPSVQGI